MNIQEFLSEVASIYETGAATEHSYRSALQTILSSIEDETIALNEPKRVKCGAPDFIVSQGDIVIGHVEAKDIPVGIRALKDNNRDQQKRYLAALPNLIYTNCLDWDFYRDGELVASVSIADFLMGIQPRPQDFATLENLLQEFGTQRPQTITSPRDLAQRMAGKANLIKDVLSKTLREDAEFQTELSAQYQAFKENLIHDITAEDFADIYAETVTYGMFAARLHDTSLGTFSRQEALELLPKSNPFLRSLFSYVAGYDLDDRIAWIIDDLARVFQACDVAKLMEGFGQLTGQNDPFLHFYETFLAAYNPSKRKARGVWYTPEPVVNFIVRAVDEVLQTEFGLPDGLADTSKVTVDWDTGQTNKRGKAVTIKKDVHRVQVLDPATGTGTFLAEVIKQIAPKIQGIAPGMWSQYIEDDLIPRLHGFELLMASYAMCHMKLDMILTELGYKPSGNPPRLSIYLTNSLEEGEPANQTLPFTQWLSREAKGANTIKRDMPIMCVIGNPPYSGISQNMGDWITNLIEDYKYVDGKHFGERKHWLHDDYVKFIRLSESLIEKNGDGVLGFITNHGYLDNPTFLGMRWHLLNTFDRIHILDLHGNAKKKEITPEGKPDKNVFDIQQGVAIIIAVKNGQKKKGLAEVWHGDLWGTREGKYASLEAGRIGKPLMSLVDCTAPQFAFVPKDHALWETFMTGFKIGDLMPQSSVGFVTARDGLTISESRACLWKRVQAFAALSAEDARKQFSLGKDAQSWKVEWAQDDVKKNLDEAKLTQISYRPFDSRWTFYTGRSGGFICRPVHKNSSHFVNRSNLGLVVGRQGQVVGSMPWNVVLCVDAASDFNLFYRGGGMSFPLYLYPDEQDLDQTCRVNFDHKLYKKLQKIANHPEHGKPGEVPVFDYIYGVLHCPAYRKTYAEFLKIDFPRIPWPTTPAEFWNVSAKGAELRKLHLMEPTSIGQASYPFTGDGDNVVGKPRFEDGRIWMNDSQYFADAPVVSWDFYIGGYQPAQKWLKDRKGRVLSFDDVKHYQKIIKILTETDRIMKTISMDLQPGGDG